MLVTKREIKTISKKCLSVLLAVVMMVSTMSVCFGTFNLTASAANIGSDFSGYTADPIEYLAEHLNGATVKKYTDKYNIGNTEASGSAGSTNNVTYITDITVDTYEEYCELRDILIYLDKAVKGTQCYQTGTADSKDEETKSCVSAGDVEAEIIDGMAGYATPSAAAKEFIAYVLEDSKAVQHADANKTDKSPKKHTATLNVFTSDYKGYLEEHNKGNYSTVDASIEMGFTYSMYMAGALYYETTGTCKEKRYHNMIWPSTYAINAPSSMADKANSSVKTTLSDYATYVDNFIATNNYNKMALMSATDIETLKNTLDSKTKTIKAYLADAGEGKQDEMYNKYFPGYADKVAKFNSDAEDAKAVAAYSTLANEIADLQAAYPAYGVFNWGGFDEATIKADYKAFTETYASLLNNTTVYNYFVEIGVFSHDFIVNFRDNVVAYDLDDLRIEKVQPLYDTYKDTWNAIEFAEQQTAYSSLSGYIKNIKSYTAQVQNAIFPDMDSFLDLEEKLECTVADCIVYFAENVNKDYSDVSTEDVIKEIATANSQLAALNALRNSVNYSANTALLDVPFANASTFIDYLYSLLGDRFTAQVNVADKAYTEIGRPTSNLTISQYSQLSAYVNAIEPDIVTYLDGVGQGAKVTQATRTTYETLKNQLMPAFNAFEADRGYTNFTAENVIIRREDNADEFFRQNADLDGDGIGEYEVTDENVENIVNLLDAALKDETVKKILGDLINKDENGNPTGEAFNLGALVSGLLEESVYTDKLINTVMQFVYPLVLKEFAKVWAGLPPTITIPDVDTGFMGIKADVEAGLKLDDVETAIASVGLYIAPTTLAANLNNVYGSKYDAVEAVLSTATTKAKYDAVNDTFRNPWENTNLFRDVVDEDGNPVLGDDGKVKREYNLVWGVDTAENKKAAFLDAAVAALSGIEPLLMALVSNKEFTNPDVTDGDARGIKIGYGQGNASVGIDLSLSIDPITLTLNFSANDGWDNALAPIFEALGLTNIPHSEDLQTTRKLLENGLLAMIDQLIAKLNDKPVEFLLNALPNLAYMLEAGMIEPLLHEIKTVINYYADAVYDAGIASGKMLNAMKSEEPININIGEMINLKDMGLDISNFKAIWNMIAGGVEMLAGIEAPDASYIASLGELVPAKTNRSVRTYTATTSNGKTLKADEAWYIDADIAAVLEYLIQWVLESGLLGGIVKNPEGLVADILAAIEENPNDAISAIVELLNQQAYPAKEYNWYDGTVDGESVVGNSAYEIYLNPGNDWTKEKAEYLYNNIDALLTAVLSMAGTELDLGATIGGAVDGLLTDKTLTSLAALLAKLDLNELLNKDKTEQEKAKALDVNALVKTYLGLDLAAVAAKYADIAAATEANPEYVEDFGVDAGEKTFAAALAEMLAPLSVVLDYLLDGGKLTITIGNEKVELLGAEGFNNAIIPLLEALGCTIPEEGTSLEKTINALVARIDALTTGDVIKNIIDLLPGVFYFITSNGLSTAVMNLLQPILTIVDTIRPVFDVMDLINNLEIGDEGAKQTISELLGGEINLKKLDFGFIFELLPVLVPAVAELDLTGVDALIYDICNNVGVEYDSASDLQETFKKGAYTESFDQADLLTVVLSFVLEWATVEDNAKKLDEMLGTNGIISALNTVFADVEITYGTPNWMYWFDTEEEFEAYVNSEKPLPNTLYALEYPNDWSEESAQYIADNLATLVDTVIALIEINGKKYTSVSALLNDLVYGDFNITVKAAEGENEAIVINYLFSDETINALLGLLKGVLANIDDALLGAGFILDVDVVGLKKYKCEKDITTIDEFFAELAYILETYAKGLVDLLFFGDDFRIAKKSDKTDTIVINGGLGYEKGLALILEALGCVCPAAEKATVKNVLAALAKRVEEILDNPVNEVIDMLPNLVYFLNANGASVAVNNLLAPAYAIIEKLEAFGVEIDLNELLGFDLKYLSLKDILSLVEEKTDLDLEAAEKILVDLCIGELEKADFTYRMKAERKDTITVILTTALMLVSDEDFAAKLDELLGTEVISAVKTVFESTPVKYGTPDWGYAVADNETLEVIDYAITYPNNWTEESAQYVAQLLESEEFDKLVAGLIDSKYTSLSELLNDKVNVFTADTLNSLTGAIANLLGDVDDKLLELGVLLKVDLVGLKAYKAPADIDTVDEFAAELADILNKYAKGVVEWLLLGDDITLLVEDADGAGEGLEGKDIITINGAYGYAEGLALILEALGCENLPEAYDTNATTEEIVEGVLKSLAARIDEIFKNPVKEVIELLPNLLYFLNANGVSVAVNNLAGAFNALAVKLKAFGLNITLNDLVDLKDILGVETEISLDKLDMATILAVVGELTELNLDKFEDVLVGFALGEIKAYDSVSSLGYTAKMQYKDEFDKHDLITVIATLAIITLTDDANADRVKSLLGEEIYQLILNLVNMGEVPVQEFDWKLTDKVGETFSAIESSEMYKDFEYGPTYTEDMAQYIADNFGDFVNNIVYLLGLDVNGDGNMEATLTELVNNLLGGSLYNSSNVVAIRDALAGVLAGITELKVNDKVVGGIIADILKTSEVADINAVAKVEVPEFTEDRDAFVKSLCDVLEPLYGLLKFVLADEDFTFFVNENKTDAIALKGAEGYAFGIIPLLEALECENILAPADYYAAVEADGDVLLTSILNPLLDRVDEIINGDPAQEILDILPNLIYFINSNGVDTVVKNTLNAVYTLLAAIEPVAKIDLYALIGVDLAEIDFEWLFDKLLDVIADATGYDFSSLDVNAIAELTVGTLESYTSLNGKTAYKMVYAEGTEGVAGASGGKSEMVTVIGRLLVTFIMHKNNQEMLLGLLRDNLGMSGETDRFVTAALALIADCAVDTRLGMDAALSTIYYLFSAADTGVDGAVGGYDSLNDAWLEALDELRKENDFAADLIEDILGLDIFEDVLTPEGFAPNGLLAFFQKIISWFKGIVEWFKNLFN